MGFEPKNVILSLAHLPLHKSSMLECLQHLMNIIGIFPPGFHNVFQCFAEAFKDHNGIFDLNQHNTPNTSTAMHRSLGGIVVEHLTVDFNMLKTWLRN